MALSEIWSIVRQGSIEPIWVEPRLDSALSTVGESIHLQSGAILRALSTVTLRVRWRADVGVNDIWRDPLRRPWYVNEVLDVGRRRYLDVGLSTYGEVSATISTVPQSPDFTPPAAWNMTLTNGTPWHNLEIDSARETNVRTREGTFRLPRDLIGQVGAVGVRWFFRLRDTDPTRRYLGQFDTADQRLPVDIQAGFHSLNFFEALGHPLTSLNAGAPDELGFLNNSATTLGPGDVLELLNANEVATFLDQ